MPVSSPQPGAYGTNLFSTFSLSRSRALSFSFPFRLWYPQCYLRQPPHIPLIILYLQYLNRFSPPPPSFLGGYAFFPLPSIFFSFFLSATGPFNFGGEAYRLPGKKRGDGRRGEGDGGREKPGWQRRAWLMPFKRGSLACQIAGCGKKMNWHIYSAYREMSCNTVSYSSIRRNKAIVRESAGFFCTRIFCLLAEETGSDERNRPEVEEELLSWADCDTFVCVVRCGSPAGIECPLLLPLMNFWSAVLVSDFVWLAGSLRCRERKRDP